VTGVPARLWPGRLAVAAVESRAVRARGDFKTKIYTVGEGLGAMPSITDRAFRLNEPHPTTTVSCVRYHVGGGAVAARGLSVPDGESLWLFLAREQASKLVVAKIESCRVYSSRGSASVSRAASTMPDLAYASASHDRYSATSLA
jgi:hypothetical protein